MKEFKLEVGTKMKLSCFMSNPEVTIDHIEETNTRTGNVSYIYKSERWFSPLTSIHCNDEGWYSRELYIVDKS